MSTSEKIRFQAPEYQRDGSFCEVDYEYVGQEKSGWKIFRQGELFQEFGPGFTAVRSVFCGICATDMARRFLPFSLPQIIGHEVVARHKSVPVVVSINASHKARSYKVENCLFCQGGLHSHCPSRSTLGIDRLPGGFSPYFLAPVAAIKKIPGTVSLHAASLTEPLAAALQAVGNAGLRNKDSVAVLGPRRLGVLIIAALAEYCRQTKRDINITAIVRRSGPISEICRKIGASTIVETSAIDTDKLAGRYDVVFDTTGNPQGFAMALATARRAVHLKSTHGQEVLGLKHLTEMVVDEISLLPYVQEHLSFSWPSDKSARQNLNIYVAPSVPVDVLAGAKSSRENTNFLQLPADEALERIMVDPTYLDSSPFPRFDLAIVGSLMEIDQVLRPADGKEVSLLRPRGAVLIVPEGRSAYDGPLLDAICRRKISIQSSRCGNLEEALRVLENNPQLSGILEREFITHAFPLNQIEKAFATAGDSAASIKVIVDTAGDQE